MVGVAVVAVVMGAVAARVGASVGSATRMADTTVVFPEVTLNRFA